MSDPAKILTPKCNKAAEVDTRSAPLCHTDRAVLIAVGRWKAGFTEDY